MLEKICALQKQYGKTPAELEVLVEGFSWVLADYNIVEIQDAMMEYISNNNDIPAPYDIIKIIRSKYTVPLMTIEQLIAYRDNGVPLTGEQQARLRKAGV